MSGKSGESNEVTPETVMGKLDECDAKWCRLLTDIKTDLKADVKALRDELEKREKKRKAEEQGTEAWIV